MMSGISRSEFPFISICSREPDNELVTPECLNLTGGAPEADGIAACRTLDYLHRSAYIHKGGLFIAAADSLDGLVREIVNLDLHVEDFKIDFLRLSKQAGFHQREAVLAAANAIHGAPDLSAPKRRFLLVARENGLLFSEIQSEPDFSYRKHAYKPHRTSNSLPARLTRGLVNLVAPSAVTIIDPCCGTGSILLEAQSMGLLVYGSDWSPQAVSMTRSNLAHFGYTGDVEQTDARVCTRRADALVTDLPYGRFVRSDLSVIKDILQNTVHLAPLAVYVAGSDISGWLQEAGYQEIQVFRVVKRGEFTRFIHRAKSDG